jgi:hypothetical protein
MWARCYGIQLCKVGCDFHNPASFHKFYDNSDNWAYCRVSDHER